MKKTLLILLGFFSLVACGPSGNKPNVELIQDMMVQPALKAQREDPWFKDGITALVPPEGTQPIGKAPYKYGNDLVAAERENKNPMTGDSSAEVMLTGQKFYNTNCMVCHGQTGQGDGPVKAKYPIPIPSLISDKVKGWSDAHIYHVITMGQGTMGPYASHIPPQYRWQVVNYIRSLQSQDRK